MDPLSILAKMLSIGLSLNSIFNPSKKFNIDELVKDIIAQLKTIVHAEFIEDNLDHAKASSETLIQNIKNNYLVDVKDKEKREDLIKDLEELNVLKDVAGSPLSEANVMLTKIADKNTTLPQKQACISMYLLLTTQILSVLQELARQKKRVQDGSLEDVPGKISAFAKTFSEKAKPIVKEVAVGRAHNVEINKSPNNDPADRLCVFAGTIKDGFLGKDVVTFHYEASYKLKLDKWTRESCGSVLGITEDRFFEVGRCYKQTLTNINSCDVLKHLIHNLVHWSDGRFETPPKIEVKYHGGSAESFYTKINDFLKWRINANSTIKSIESLIDNPLPAPPSE